MKFLSLVLLMLFIISCTSDAASGNVSAGDTKLKQGTMEEIASNNVNEAIALARENKDYRLLVTSGRSMSVPGVKASDYKAMIGLCGKKYNSAAGDVLTSEEQRLERKKLVTYMRQYNEQMLVICQENSNK